MSKDDLIKYWFDTAEEDWKTAEGLFDLGYYMQSLFYIHTMIIKDHFIKKLPKNIPKSILIMRKNLYYG